MTKRPEVSIVLNAADVTALRLPSADLIAEANRYAKMRVDATLFRDRLNSAPGFQGRDAAVSNVDAVIRQLLRIEGEMAREIEAQIVDEDMTWGQS